MRFPTHDWQFWVVSVLALAGLAWLLRPFWPGRRPGRGGKQKVALTVGGKEPEGRKGA